MENRCSEITVCLATYNGEVYINQQLNSIINQTTPVNEIIVSDDASSDATIAMVEGMKRREISIIANQHNLRHVKNFEKAIIQSSGDIVFLSDQDDLWTPDKVEKVMQVFNTNPEVVMVHHNLTTMDERGDVLKKGYVSFGGSGLQFSSLRFILREFAQPRLFGCAMAFRRCVLDLLIPFPSFVYAHDHWISVASAFAGKIYLLDENLVFYRQHSKNLTPKTRRSLSLIIKSRFLFAKMIICAFVRSYRLVRFK